MSLYWLSIPRTYSFLGHHFIFRGYLVPVPPPPNMLVTKCGAWGCFDEFNRLKDDQLCAISQLIQLIQDAIKAKRPDLK